MKNKCIAFWKNYYSPEFVMNFYKWVTTTIKERTYIEKIVMVNKYFKSL